MDTYISNLHIHKSLFGKKVFDRKSFLEEIDFFLECYIDDFFEHERLLNQIQQLRNKCIICGQTQYSHDKLEICRLCTNNIYNTHLIIVCSGYDWDKYWRKINCEHRPLKNNVVTLCGEH